MALFNETYPLTGDDAGNPTDSIFGVNSGVGVLKAEAALAVGGTVDVTIDLSDWLEKYF